MKRKVFRKAAAMLLTASMALAASVTAFAATTTTPAAYSPEANITVGKTLTAKQAGVWPDITTFTFKLEAFSYTAGPETANTAYTAYDKSNMPMPAAGTANTAAALTAGAMTETVTVSGFDRSNTGTSQTLKVTTGNAAYTQAGVYTYKLSEVVPADADKEAGVSYDESLYYVNVYVTNVLKEDGTPLLGDNGLPVVNVSNITAYKGTNGATDPMAADYNNVGAGDSTTDSKIGITTPDPNSSEPRNIEYPFKNDYATADLVVTKKVTGTMADVKKEFSFTLSLKNSHDAADGRSYAYQVWSMGADETKGTADDVQVTGTGKSGNITNGGTFTLKHDEYIVVKGLASGEKVTVTETGATDYKTSISSVFGDVTAASTAGTDTKSLAEQTVVTADNAVNQQDFVNNKEAVTPTGILLVSLPFVLIVIVAGAALFFVLRKRRYNGR